MGVNARDARLRNAVEDGWERFEASRGLNVSLETGAVLARQGLLIEAQEDPAGAARLLEARLQTQTEPDGALALAELSYHVGVDSQTSDAGRGDGLVSRCGHSRRAGPRRPGRLLGPTWPSISTTAPSRG